MKVNVEYLKDHASKKKGEKAEMYKSTAEALAKHKVVKVVSEKKKE